jgi:G6PDH family F420-dependent oxidoreductase
MTTIGYKLSSEEQAPNDLVRHARMAEDAGFDFALISDHYHPWIDRQGQSPFVWSVVGALAHATRRLRVGTAVTCPTVRIHPAIVAQAAATSAAMMPGRFVLGVGTGENLNEHVVGARWPETEVRHAMLEEAIGVIRLLWEGGNKSHHGPYYTVENARLYTLPETPPPIVVAVAGPRSAELAGRLGDGMVGTSPDRDSVKRFAEAGGGDKPRYGELSVCWARDERAARKRAREWWPTAAIAGPLHWELPLPEHFEAAAALVTEDAIAEEVVCGPDARRHVEAIREYAEAGYDHVCVHQVGPDQAGFIDFYAREVLPRVRGVGAARPGAAVPRVTTGTARGTSPGRARCRS